MRASAIWLVLGTFWSLDAFFEWRHGARQALVAAIAAAGFFAVGIYFAARAKFRAPRTPR